MTELRPRIIHILGILSPYSMMEQGHRPGACWKNAEGQILGVYDEHWSDLLCRAILGVTREFDLEVWQPDLRADRVYEHVFDDGLKHVLFPASSGTGSEDVMDPSDLRSPMLTASINSLNGERAILQLNELTNPLTEFILNACEIRVPILLHQYGGTSYFRMATRGKNLVRRLGFVFKGFRQRRLCRQLKAMVVHTSKSRRDMKTIYRGPIALSTMGVDFDYWCPGDKGDARAELGIPGSTFVLLTASMLRPKKQVDKLMKLLCQLDQEGQEFLYLVVGAGDSAYEEDLKDIAASMDRRGKVRFLGRLPDSALLTAYRAADLFASVSSSEGGPVSVMKAFACEVPVLTTDVGHVAEFLKRRGGEVILPDDTRIWKKELDGIISRRYVVRSVSREDARQEYDWSVIGRRFRDFYRALLSNEQFPEGAGE